MMRRILFGAAAAVLALAGCTTTEEANKAIKSRWIGQPSDAFFSQYGMPMRSFPLNNGGVVYSWRGGETVRVVPAQYRTVTPAATAQPVAGRTNTSTTTTVTQPSPNTTITRTTTTSSSIGIGLPAAPGQVLVSPERREQLFCEAQITADANGVIVNIEATRDTTGAGFNLSRCAEVFNVE